MAVLILFMLLSETFHCGNSREFAEREQFRVSEEPYSLSENILDQIIRTNENIPDLELFEGDIVHDTFVDFVYKYRSQNDVTSKSDVTLDSDVGKGFDVTPVDDVLDNMAYDAFSEALYAECPAGQVRGEKDV